MTLGQRRTGADEISRRELVAEPQDARVLGDDVPEPTECDAVEPRQGLEPDLGRSLGADLRHCRLELPSALGVAGVDVAATCAVLDTGGDHDEAGLPRDRHRRVLEAAAIEEDGLSLATEDRRRLIEDPAGDADRAQLGSLARRRERHRRQCERRRLAQRQPDCDLERR